MSDHKVKPPPSYLPDFALKELTRLAEESPDGNFAEVGVYHGGSAWHFLQVAKKRGNKLFLFDTFTGMPYKGEYDVIDIGLMKTDLKQVSKILEGAHIYPGIFPETLTDEVTDLALVHVDCDTYITCKDCIWELWPRLVPDGIMIFDDYPLKGIANAIHECFAAKPQVSAGGLIYIRKETGNELRTY